MSEYNTKSEMSENVVIRTFRENSSGAVYRFPVFGLMPNDIQATAYWFAKELQPDLYEVSSLIPSSLLIPSSIYYEVPRIEIDVLGFSYYPHETGKIVILPDGVDGTDCYTGVDKNGHLVQIKESTLFDKELFTELKESKMETETEKTFIPESGDWIIADIRHRDGRLSGHVGEVVKRSYGYFTGDSYYDPMVFDEKGNVESQVTHIEVFRNHKFVFSYSKDEPIIMEETNSVFDILVVDENYNLIERIGPFVESYDDVVALGYSRLSKKKPGQPKPAYFTIEKKFIPLTNQTED